MDQPKYAIDIANDIGDSDAIFELINKSYQIEIGDTGVSFKTTNRLLHKYEAGLEAAYAESRVLKVTFGSQIVGAMLWELGFDTVDNGSKEQFISFGPIAVHPSYQGKGIARIMIEKVKDIGKSLGLVSIRISVVNHRTDLLPIYSKLGFEVIGVQDYDCMDRLSRPCKFVIMRKPIS